MPKNTTPDPAKVASLPDDKYALVMFIAWIFADNPGRPKTQIPEGLYGPAHFAFRKSGAKIFSYWDFCMAAYSVAINKPYIDKLHKDLNKNSGQDFKDCI